MIDKGDMESKVSFYVFALTAAKAMAFSLEIAEPLRAILAQLSSSSISILSEPSSLKTLNESLTKARPSFSKKISAIELPPLTSMVKPETDKINGGIELPRIKREPRNGVPDHQAVG